MMIHSWKYKAAALSLTLLFILIAGSLHAVTPNSWLPFASAPAGEYGAVLTGEYDMRDFGGDDVAVRKLMFKIGWTPTKLSAFWIEGGLGSLFLECSGNRMQGDFGTALGAGTSLSLPKIPYIGISLLGTAKASMFVSKLSHDRSLPNDEFESRRSRYEWREVDASFGLARQFGGINFYGGAGALFLKQKEDRHMRSSNGNFKSSFNYDSGVKPGVVGALTFQLRNRLHLLVSASVYDGSRKISIAFGQWGSPVKKVSE